MAATTTATAYDTSPGTYTTTRVTEAAYPAGASSGGNDALHLLAQRLQALTEDGVRWRAEGSGAGAAVSSGSRGCGCQRRRS